MISGKVGTLAKRLLAELETGELEEGASFHSVREAAELYGTSVPTAYRALNHLAACGYLSIRNGAGTFVRRSFALRKLKLVGVPLRLQSNPQILDFYETLSAVAEERGIRLLMGNGQTGASEIPCLRKFAESGVDGIIRFPTAIAGEESMVREELRRLQLKCVIVNDWWRPGEGFASVKIDETDGTTRLLDALFAAGHRRIALHQETFNGIRPDIHNAFCRWHWRHDIRMSASSFLYWPQFADRLEEYVGHLKGEGFTAVLFSYGLNIRDLLAIRPAFVEEFALASLDDIPQDPYSVFAAYQHDNGKLAQTALRLLADGRSDDAPQTLIPGMVTVGGEKNGSPRSV